MPFEAEERMPAQRSNDVVSSNARFKTLCQKVQMVNNLAMSENILDGKKRCEKCDEELIKMSSAEHKCDFTIPD